MRWRRTARDATMADVGDDSTVDVLALLNVGTAGEVVERAEKSRNAKGLKGQRARHARETLDILAAGGYEVPYGGEWVDLRSSVQKAVEASTYFAAELWHPVVLPQPTFDELSTLEVRCCPVLAAAEQLSRREERALGVLNFASARNPGGGFTTGAEAQEESIARSSALYPCLTRHFDAFFVPSRRARSGAYTHDVIYSPRVPVIRDAAGILLNEPYEVDFATAAAPNVGSLNSQGNGHALAEEALRERIPRVLELFARHGVVDLVLGAWGCGVFGNRPSTVAALFKESLQTSFRGHFRNVVFAVSDPRMVKDFGSCFAIDVG